MNKPWRFRSLWHGCYTLRKQFYSRFCIHNLFSIDVVTDTYCFLTEYFKCILLEKDCRLGELVLHRLKKCGKTGPVQMSTSQSFSSLPTDISSYLQQDSRDTLS